MSEVEAGASRTREIDELRDQVSMLTQALVHSGTITPNATLPGLGELGEGRKGRSRKRTAVNAADPVVQRSFRLRKSLALRFKAKAAANGLSIQEAMNALMLAYLEDNTIIDGVRHEAAEL